jgi:hypothetical protein
MAQVALTKGCLIKGSMDLLCDFHKIILIDPGLRLMNLRIMA